MNGLSAKLPYGLISVIIVCFFFPAAGLTADSGSLAGLRNRIKVLVQARNEASAELEDKVRQGSVTERDRQHYQTVAAFLEQQVADSCSQLIDEGGVTAAAGIPCPNSSSGLKKNTEKKAVKEDQDRAPEREQEKEKVAEAAKESSPKVPPTAVPPETAEVKQKKVEQVTVPEKAPDSGVFAAIRRWWESLFAPKPPPAASSTESGNPREEKDKKAAGEKNDQQAVSDGTPPTEPGDASGDKKSAESAGNPEVASTGSLAGEKTSSQKKGKEKTQASQPTNNDSEHLADRGKTRAGQGEKKSSEAAVAAKAGQEKHAAEEQGSSENTSARDGSAEKAVQPENGAGNGSKEEQKKSASGTGTAIKKTATTGKDGKKHGAEKNSAAAGEASARPVKKSTVVKGNRQAAAGGNGKRPPADAELSSLDKSLSDALGEFDGKLLKEQERLAARIPKQREGSGGGGYGAAGGGGIFGDGHEGQEGDSRAGAGGNQQSGSVVSGSGKPAPDGGRSTIEADDDIVARQLREAAEKETDPVLKEKLWQEYRKYKQGR
jgi:hypothetical protein